MFGGGGHCNDPYAQAVMTAVRKDAATNPRRRSDREAEVVGLPLPPDLDLRGGKERWMSRLAVAYGLSFQKEELAEFTYPKELRDRPVVRRETRSWERPRNA